jgi:ABC-type nitrate/sulfonate/bicarbonate transport system substrate-binding protein
LVFVESGRTVPGVLSKDTPIVSTDGSLIFSPNAEGADLVAVGATGSTPTDMVVGGRDISDPAQLKGKIGGVNALTDETTALMKYALEEQFGLTPDQDVRIISVGGESVRIAALAADRVQATIVDRSLKDQMLDEGFHILYDYTTGDLPWNKNVILTTRSYAQENPKVVECFLMALTEATHFYKTNKDGSVDIAFKYSEGMDKETLGTLWDIYAPDYPDLPSVGTEGFTLMQELNSDPRAQEIDLNTLVDTSYVDKLESSGFVESLQ